jgi:hypothetical protein
MDCLVHVFEFFIERDDVDVDGGVDALAVFLE